MVLVSPLKKRDGLTPPVLHPCLEKGIESNFRKPETRMAPSFSSDKRIAQRFHVKIHLRFRLLESPSGEKPEAELHNGNNVMSNISRTGFFLSTKNYLEVGSRIEVEFPLESFKAIVRAEARVIRANHSNYPNLGRYEYGLYFEAMHPHFRELLEKLSKLAEA
jgi:hypothetical protein